MTGVTRVQTVSMNIQAAENNTALSAAFGSAITSGNYLLVLFSTRDSNPGNYTVTDNKSNSWTPLPSVYDGGGGRGVGGAYCLANAGSIAAAPTVSIGKGGTGGAAGGTMFELNCPSGAFLDVTPVVVDSSGTAAQVTLAANPYDHDAVFAVLCTGPTSFVTATPLSGYTSLNAITNSTTAFQHAVIVKDTTTSAVQTPGWTLGSSVQWEVLGFALRGTTTSPTITGVSTATPRENGSLDIIGVNFQASQGTGSVSFGGTTPQTVNSWSDTLVNITPSKGLNKFGVPLGLVITVNGGTTSNTFSGASLLPPTGWKHIDITTPNATTTYRVTSTLDMVSANQLAWDTGGGKLDFDATGVPEWNPTLVSANAELWVPTFGYGSLGLQTFSAGAATVATINGIALAAISTINGVAKASISSINGLSLT